jgi:CMP/dCMP kinase
MVVAIDGPAGSGKSAVARALAGRLGFRYLDSGAMYRCVALLASASPDRDPAALAREARIEPLADRVILDGRDVSEEIRAPEISEMASRVAADPGVRAELRSKQRALLAAGNWVAEGRDIGTVVAPGAELKIFLTASPRERARRRADERGADPEQVLAEQQIRDERDSTRADSPLEPAPDAVTFDTTHLSIDAVLARVAELVRVAELARASGSPR